MRHTATLTALALLMSGPILAQDAVRQNQQSQELRADWIVGTTVLTPDGETIGTIDDLLLDREDGSVTAAIVSVGGFLGFGAKQIAVKWQDLEEEYDGTEVVLALTRDEAEGAPEFNFRDQEVRPPPPVPEPTTGLGTTPAPATAPAQ